MADSFLDRIISAIMPTPQLNVAQSRWTQTPIFYKPMAKGDFGRFRENDIPSDILTNAITAAKKEIPSDLHSQLESLAQSWAGRRGATTINTEGFLPSTHTHEDAHAIYTAAGLDPYAQELVNQVPNQLYRQLANDPFYSLAPDLHKMIADEGFSRSIGGIPGMDKDKYVKFIADRITNQKLRDTLLRMHQSRQNLNQISGYPEDK